MMKKGLALIICIWVLLVGQPLWADEAQEKKNIIIVSSYGIDNSFANKIINRLLAQLTDSELTISYQVIYMDVESYESTKEFEHSLNGLQETYQNVTFNIDAIVSIGYEAFLGVQDYLMESGKDIPLIAGGIRKSFASTYSSGVPYIGVASDLNMEEYSQQIIDIQPELETVYCLASEKWEIDSFIPGMKSQFEQQGISVNIIHAKDLPHQSFQNQFWNRKKIVLLLSYQSWNDQGKRMNVVEYLKEIRKYYSGPLYCLNGTQFYELMEKWEGPHFPLGTVIRELGTEGEMLGQKVLEVLEHPQELSYGIEDVQANLVITYQGLKEYGLYQSKFADQYEILQLPASTVVLPRLWVGGVLFCSLLLLSMLVYFLYTTAKRSSILAKQGMMGKIRYERLLSMLPDPVIQVRNGMIEYINGAGIQCLGAEKKEELLGESIDCFFVSCQPWGQEKVSTVPEKETIRMLNGQTREVEVSTVTYFQPETIMLMVIQDMTEEKKMLDQMEYDRLRTEFFSTLSHELRTPINVVLSTSKLLEKKFSLYYDEYLDKYNGILRQNSYRLVRLINNLIDSTKLDTGYLQLELQLYNVVEVTENLVSSVLPYAEMREIKITFDTQSEEIYAQIDKEKYERILLNVLSNSIKYNKEQGEIFISISAEQEKIKTIISDTGIGIPQEKLNAIFEPFVQVKPSAVSHIEGSGIGLSIVKALVDLHGGTINVDSKVGEYTTFVIEMSKVELTREMLLLVKHSWDDGKEGIDIELSDIG